MPLRFSLFKNIKPDIVVGTLKQKTCQSNTSQIPFKELLNFGLKHGYGAEREWSRSSYKLAVFVHLTRTVIF